MKEEIRAMALTLVSAAVKKHVTLAFAESCTGGMAATAVTEISGSSEVFMGSAVTYSNEAKAKILGVSKETLDSYGAVSAECAEEMAEGAARIYGSDIAMSVTGIAGPGGGSPEKPVGTVWFGFTRGGKTVSFKCAFRGERRAIREASVKKILAHITGELE